MVFEENRHNIVQHSADKNLLVLVTDDAQAGALICNVGTSWLIMTCRGTPTKLSNVSVGLRIDELKFAIYGTS